MFNRPTAMAWRRVTEIATVLVLLWAGATDCRAERLPASMTSHELEEYEQTLSLSPAQRVAVESGMIAYNDAAAEVRSAAVERLAGIQSRHDATPRARFGQNDMSQYIACIKAEVDGIDAADAAWFDSLNATLTDEQRTLLGIVRAQRHSRLLLSLEPVREVLWPGGDLDCGMLCFDQLPSAARAGFVPRWLEYELARSGELTKLWEYAAAMHLEWARDAILPEAREAEWDRLAFDLIEQARLQGEANWAWLARMSTRVHALTEARIANAAYEPDAARRTSVCIEVARLANESPESPAAVKAAVETTLRSYASERRAAGEAARRRSWAARPAMGWRIGCRLVINIEKVVVPEPAAAIAKDAEALVDDIEKRALARLAADLGELFGQFQEQASRNRTAAQASRQVIAAGGAQQAGAPSNLAEFGGDIKPTSLLPGPADAGNGDCLQWLLGIADSEMVVVRQLVDDYCRDVNATVKGARSRIDALRIGMEMRLIPNGGGRMRRMYSTPAEVTEAYRVLAEAWRSLAAIDSALQDNLAATLMRDDGGESRTLTGIVLTFAKEASVGRPCPSLPELNYAQPRLGERWDRLDACVAASRAQLSSEDRAACRTALVAGSLELEGNWRGLRIAQIDALRFNSLQLSAAQGAEPASAEQLSELNPLQAASTKRLWLKSQETSACERRLVESIASVLSQAGEDRFRRNVDSALLPSLALLDERHTSIASWIQESKTLKADARAACESVLQEWHDGWHTDRAKAEGLLRACLDLQIDDGGAAKRYKQIVNEYSETLSREDARGQAMVRTMNLVIDDATKQRVTEMVEAWPGVHVAEVE